MTGRVDGLDDTFAEATLLVERHADELPLAASQLVLNRAATLMAQGRLDESAAQCAAALEGDVDPASEALLQAWLGCARGTQGRIDDAIVSQRHALELLEDADPFRLQPQSVGLLLLHRSQTADPPPTGVGQLRDALDAAGSDVRLAVWPRRARTWIQARSGDQEAAAASAVEAGTDAIAGEHVAWGMMALHDAVRLGLWEPVLAPLETALPTTEGAELLTTMVAHARALRRADVDGLDEVAGRFGAHGCLLYAAEASAQASTAAADQDDHLRARRIATRGALWARRCPGAATPGLEDLSPDISDRELDVIALALGGPTSQAIADALFVSRRTVDNHLHAVYRKLELSGREELADVLGSTGV